ncbi:MAG: glycosyltransferase family 4 protein [Bacteroidales bacterium]|nr:glycosyltransferase family 4 protein [Bacteroidales bacterium]
MTNGSGINAFEKGKSIPLSIGFDAKRAFFNPSGLGNYSRNLLSAVSKSYPENSYYLFTPKIKGKYTLANEDNFKIVQPGPGVFRLLGSLWRSKYMRNDIRKHKLDVFHGLSQELPVGIENSGARSVVTVHDLIFMRFPKYYKKIDVKIYSRKLRHACKVSDHIVAISRQTKDDIVEYLDISPDKISVIYQGCNPYFRNSYSKEFFREVRAKYNLPERYLLYVGTIEERKNLLGIVKAMHLRHIEVPLVAIGRKTDNYFRNVQDYITANNLNNIIFPDRVLSFELPVIYQNAECFIYPSFFEGFGIPLVEALVSKIPVITSETGCFAEAAGPGSLYVDPHNPETIGDAICKVIDNKEFRDKMITTGTDYANNFRDDVIARAYMELYHSLLR